MTTHAPAELTTVPLVDLGTWFDGTDAQRRAVARHVDEALSACGFLLVTGHGIPNSVRCSARAAAHQFFVMPTEVKRRYAVGVGGRGWLPPGAEANAAAEGTPTPPDLKESWSTGADPAVDPDGDPFWFAPTPWPAEVPALEGALTEHMTAARALADELLMIGAVALDLAPDFFTRHTHRPSYTLNVNRYPPLTEVGEPADGQFRIGPHTDFGTFTVLDREVGSGGLQVDVPGVGWVDAPHHPGALTINVGDLLARWTGGRWRSARHRVLPPQDAAPDEELTSLVFFYELDPDTWVQPLGHTASAGVRAGDYLAAKLSEITVS